VRRTCATLCELLAVRRHKKLHWRDEDPARQKLIVETIAALQVEHLVVIRSDSCQPGVAGRRVTTRCGRKVKRIPTPLRVDR
jgi:hypothetical protein